MANKITKQGMNAMAVIFAFITFILILVQLGKIDSTALASWSAAAINIGFGLFIGLEIWTSGRLKQEIKKYPGPWIEAFIATTAVIIGISILASGAVILPAWASGLVIVWEILLVVTAILEIFFW